MWKFVFPNMNSSLIDGLISLALGGWVSLIGFGVVSASKDKTRNDELRKKYGTFFKVGGILIALWGAYNVVRGL